MRVVTARKYHRCCWCGFGIRKGDKYYTRVVFNEGVYNKKLHFACKNAINDIDWYDPNYEYMRFDNYYGIPWAEGMGEPEDYIKEKYPESMKIVKLANSISIANYCIRRILNLLPKQEEV